jgi:hypothetical protein
LLHSRVALLHLFRGSVLWLRGSLHMCRGSSLWCSSSVSMVCALCLSMFCLGCVEPLPLPKGSEPCSSSSDLAPCLSLAFDHLLEFSFICFFSFLFLFGYKPCVLSMHSSRGRLRTMCGSRTGGWSLPCVSHPIFRRKPSAYLYACQDHVSCI